MGKLLKAATLASIVSIIAFYIFADLLGSQMVLKEAYLLDQEIWRNPSLLTRNLTRVSKYLMAFFLTNLLWAYIFNLRKDTLTGSGVRRGIKFFFILWLFTIPMHFWFWVMIYYPIEILIYNVFVTHLYMFTLVGIVIGKVCVNGDDIKKKS